MGDLNNKRGLSMIITVVILLLLAIVSIGIIWVFISNFLESERDRIEAGAMIVDLEINYAKVYADENNLVIKVKREKGEGSLSKIKFIFSNNTDTLEIKKEVEMREGSTLFFKFSLDGFSFDFTKVSVAPIVVLESGNEFVKDITDTKEVSYEDTCTFDCDLSDDAIILELGDGDSGGGNFNGITINPNTIIPLPQDINSISSDTLFINSSWVILTDLNNENDSFTADYLKEFIYELSDEEIDLQILNFDEGISGNSIVIGNPKLESELKNIATQESIDIDLNGKNKYNQGYVLLNKPTNIFIFSNSTVGNFYGMITLTWLLNYYEDEITFQNIKINDWPDYEIRAFGGGRWANYYDSSEDFIEDLAKYKYNVVGSLIRPITNTSTQSYIDEQIFNLDELRKRYIEPRVSIEPTIIQYYDENYYEGVFAYNTSFIFNDLEYAKNDETQLIISNGDFEEEINDPWSFENNDEDSSWIRDCDESYSGDCSAKLVVYNNLIDKSSAYLKLGNSNNLLPLEKNEIYFVSFWARTNRFINGVIENKPQLTANFYNESGGPVQSSSSYKSAEMKYDLSDNWKQFSLPISTYNNEFYVYFYSRALSTNELEFWIDDFKIYRINNLLRNVVQTESNPLEVWNIDRSVKYEKNVDYSIEQSGEFDFDNPLNGMITNVKRNIGGNIASNENVLIDYDYVVNFQAPFRKEHVTMAEEAVFEFYENKVIKSTFETLNPKYIRFDLGELRGFNRDSRSKKLNLSNYQLYAQYVNKTISLIRKYSPNSVIFWNDDMVSELDNGGIEDYQVRYGGQLGKTSPAFDLIPRENMYVFSWWYNTRDWRGKMANSPAYFKALGFDNWMPSSFNNPQNIRWWSYLGYKNNAKGFFQREYNSDPTGFIIGANYSWNAIKEYSGECNPDYFEICDGKDNDCDNLYWVTSTIEATGASNIDEGFFLNNDTFNCGTCENVCYYPRSYASCVEGSCQFDGCYEGYYDLNDDLSDGCEHFSKT
jgi:hypothetical protein